jgi:chromosome segregation ATPase
MTILAELAAVTGSAKTLIGLLQEINPNKKAVSNAAQALLSSTLSLQGAAFQLQEENSQLGQAILKLESEVARLREQIRGNEVRAIERQKYQRKQVHRSWILVNDDHPGALFCPACFASKDQAIPLQPLSPMLRHTGTYSCPLCQAHYYC